MSNSVLESVVKQATFKGETLVVSALKVGQIPAFIRAVRPMFGALASLLPSIPLGDQEGEGAELQIPDMSVMQLFELVADHGEELIEAVAVAIRKPAKEVAELDTPEFISLLRAVVEVNADFFVRLVAKEMAAPALGTTPSSS